MEKLHKSIPASGSSYIDIFEFLAISEAISILFTSPPDKELSTSLFRYSLEQSPTFDKYSQHSSSDKLLPAANCNNFSTVTPLNLGGCWKAYPIPILALSVILKSVISTPSK